MGLGHSFRQRTLGGLSACLSCGSALPEDAEVCPACGKPIAPLKTINSNTFDGRVGPRTDMPLSSAMIPRVDANLAQLPKFLPERYELVKLLGQGGMGAVYHCIDRQLERPVAIKVMTDKFRSTPQGETRFMREARTQAIVNHANVSTILNFGVSPEGRLFLVMEYLEGEDLRDFLRKRGKIDPMLACELMRQALEGLQEAHTCGLVHRDLKPSNIMIVQDHRGLPLVKILDLGLAKMVGGQTDLMSITMDTATQLIGTPAYMSPEQVAGSKVDARADLYSMGVVFYEMLAGRLPFESETLQGWLYQHLHETPEMPSHYNPDLEKCPDIELLPMWLLEKRPDNRPQSAGDAVKVLMSALAGKSIADLIPNSLRTSPADAPPRPGSGSKKGIGSGSRQGIGAGSGHGAGSGSVHGIGSGSGHGIGSGSGRGVNSGTALGVGSGTRQGARPGSGPRPAVSSGTAPGVPIFPGSSNSASGSGPQATKLNPPLPSDRPRPPSMPRRSFSGELIPNSSARLTGIARMPASSAPPSGSQQSVSSGSQQSISSRTQRPSSNSINLITSITGLTPDQARTSFDHACADGTSAELAGNLALALKNWIRAQALSEMYGLPSAAAQIEECKHQIEFENTLASSDTAAKAGDWQTADDLLQQLAVPQEIIPRLEAAKTNMPRRLVAAWLVLATQKIRALPEGDIRRDLSERYMISCAASGDMNSAINFLDSAPRRAEMRIISFAQAVAAAIRHGHTDGMRPYLDRLKDDLALIANPAEHGKACLEVGRTFAVYGDLESAASALRDAYLFFGEALNQGIPIAVAERPLGADTRSTRSSPLPTQSMGSTKTLNGGKSVRASWLTAICALADAQAEAGLIDDCLKSAAAIDDPWTKSLVLSQLVQNFTRSGRHELAERHATGITFALPKTQALRAIAISKIYREDVEGAEEMMVAIPAPAERLPIFGVMAVFYGLRKEPTKPRTIIANLLAASKQIVGAVPRFHALAAAAEPMLSAGLHDMARAVYDEALQLIAQIEDPPERVRCLLHLVKLKEVRRDAVHSTTRTVAFGSQPQTQLLDMLRQALFAARLLRTDRDKLECFENMATRIAAAYLPVLATEMLNAFKDDADQAAIYIGLTAGMV